MLKLTITGKLDLRGALDELDPAVLPSDGEIDSILRKRLTKGDLVLTPLAPGECIREGDSVIFSAAGGTGKFNRPKLTVTVGQGLYSRDVEASMLGRRPGDSYDTPADGTPVRITIQEVRRKSVPEPTDEMAAAMGIEGVRTVAEYRAHLAAELTNYALSQAAWDTFDRLKEQVQVGEPDEETVRQIAGRLRKMYVDSYLEQNPGSSEDALPPETEEFLNKYVVGNLAELAELAKNCALLGAALGVELTGDTDPVACGNAYGNLIDQLRNVIEDDLKRRN